MSGYLLRAFVFAPLILLAGAVCADTTLESPYVPTPEIVVDRMLRMGRVGPDDYVIDLGSGDGRIVITAAKKFGARGLGIELDQELVERSRKNALREGVASRVEFRVQDLFAADISRATVVTLYLLPDVNRLLIPKLMKELKSGTRIVGHDFGLGSWTPDETDSVDVPEKYFTVPGVSNVFLWHVPARARGSWRAKLPAPGGEVAFQVEQSFQKLDVTGTLAGRELPFRAVRLRGDEIGFNLLQEVGGQIARWNVAARVGADTMQGTVTRGDGRSFPFQATRVR